MNRQAQASAVSFTLNGRQVQVDDLDDLTLLDLLRDRLGITSPKNGCQPQGQCGCCTVLVDGRPKLSCQMEAGQVAGKRVTTLEGLPEEQRRLLAECFVRAGAVQCGYCTPGIAMRMYALLERNGQPSRAEIAAELAAHICRCTGYKKIIDAVELLARVREGEAMPPSENGPGGVGARLDRYRGRDAVLGQRKFIADITVPGMVFAAMRFSNHPRALVRRIDTAAAAAVEGVLGVLTWKDVPGERYVGLIEQDWPIFIAEGEETRCIGDVLAVVVATEARTARRAAGLVNVEYEVRTPVVDPREALRPDSPRIHAKGNLLERSALARGDVDAALAGSAHVVEGVWETQRVEHLFMEPEACIAIPVRWADGQCCGWWASPETGSQQANSTGGTPVPQESGGTPVPLGSGGAGSNQLLEAFAGAAPRGLKPAAPLIAGPARGVQDGMALDSASGLPPEERGLYVLSPGQGIFDDRRQICRILGWPETRVEVELVANGGAFGGKEDLSVQGQTALAAHVVGRPVKTVLTRAESLRLHPKRHPIRLDYRVGCDEQGRLTALRARIVGDTGAYASVGGKVLERAAGHAAGPYRVPNLDIEALAVYTNNPPSGAMRGFGVPQAAFAIEGCLDMLAEKVGIDGWEMRSRNILEPGDVFCTGQRMTKPFGLRKTLEAVKDVYRGAKCAGIACGIKNVGIGNALPESGRASLTIEEGGRVTVRSGFTEMGQGLFTVLIQTAVEETGLPAHVFAATTDTRHALNCGQTTGSRGTVLGCHGVRDAARKLRADLDAGRTLGDLAGRVYVGQWDCFPTDKFGADVPDPRTHLTYGFATQVVVLDDRGRIEKVVAAHDVGKAINPTLAEGQIEGAVHMGLGYALTEELVVEGGRIQSYNVRDLGVLRAHQMPEVDVILVEEGDPDCPYGTRGIGEIGLVPTAAAVAGALYAFDGIRRTKLPMKDSPAATAITRPAKRTGA